MNTPSFPIWSRHGDVDDQFIGVITGAPAFERLQSYVTYTITLDMVFNSLSQGVRNVASRAKDEEKARLYMHALEKLDAARAAYIQGANSVGETSLMEAHNVFRHAARKSPRWNVG